MRERDVPSAYAVLTERLEGLRRRVLASGRQPATVDALRAQASMMVVGSLKAMIEGEDAAWVHRAIQRQPRPYLLALEWYATQALADADAEALAEARALFAVVERAWRQGPVRGREADASWAPGPAQDISGC